jgi:hypothetical protein
MGLGDKMSKTTTIIAVVAAVVIVAAIGVVLLTGGDNDDSNDDGNGIKTNGNNVTFLVQDSKGIYFWITGSGETVQDAFIDSFSAYPKGTLETNSYGISTLFGVGTTQDPVSNNYSWWGQFSWSGSAWTYNATESMPNILSKDTDYFLVIYGEGTMDGIAIPAGTPVPKDAYVWNGSTSGTVFTIASPTGLFYKINGSSNESLLKALEAACAKANVPFESNHLDGVGDGIASIYGLATTSDPVTGYSWWAQFIVEDGNWKASSLWMSNLDSSDNPQFLVLYGKSKITDRPVW